MSKSLSSWKSNVASIEGAESGNQFELLAHKVIYNGVAGDDRVALVAGQIIVHRMTKATIKHTRKGVLHTEHRWERKHEGGDIDVLIISEVAITIEDFFAGLDIQDCIDLGFGWTLDNTLAKVVIVECCYKIEHNEIAEAKMEQLAGLAFQLLYSLTFPGNIGDQYIAKPVSQGPTKRMEDHDLAYCDRVMFDKEDAERKCAFVLLVGEKSSRQNDFCLNASRLRMAINRANRRVSAMYLPVGELLEPELQLTDPPTVRTCPFFLIHVKKLGRQAVQQARKVLANK